MRIPNAAWHADLSKRKCYSKCGDIGHIARDCSKKGSTEKSVVVCNHCNKPGLSKMIVGRDIQRRNLDTQKTSGAAVEILVANLEIEDGDR